MVINIVAYKTIFLFPVFFFSLYLSLSSGASMSLETRSSSALFKRAEQLKRWEQSETNREPAHPRQIARKIKFSADCVFLAACAAGDKEEVVRLLQKGADINTGNVDGLTALHQVRKHSDII